MERKYFRVTVDECPKTRAEFVSKMRSDVSFRLRAEATGFRVIGDSVLFPNGMVANPTVK